MQINSKYKTLQKDFDYTDKLLSVDPKNQALIRKKIKHELELQNIQKAKSAQTRSREKFIEEGEKNTKYFVNLEKANTNSNILDGLKPENGELVTSQKAIMQEQVTFFRNVFNQKGSLNETKAESFARNINTPQLTKYQTDDLESDISEEEIDNALKHTRNGTSPGLDGLTASFLIFFWLTLNKRHDHRVSQIRIRDGRNVINAEKGGYHIIS